MRAAPLRQALDFSERPDPRRGIFETVLIKDGSAALLDPQLARLAASARRLYAREVDVSAAAAAARAAAARVAAARAAGRARLRLSFEPGRPGHGVAIDHGPVGPDPHYTAIAPFALPGGLGEHKWLDRRLPDALTAACGPAAVALIIDSDGAVLEAASMNVLIEERGRLISPLADGRWRPGFGRQRLRYDEEPVDLDRLLAADAVVLTSALRTMRLVG